MIDITKIFSSMGVTREEAKFPATHLDCLHLLLSILIATTGAILLCEFLKNAFDTLAQVQPQPLAPNADNAVSDNNNNRIQPPFERFLNGQRDDGNRNDLEYILDVFAPHQLFDSLKNGIRNIFQNSNGDEDRFINSIDRVGTSNNVNSKRIAKTQSKKNVAAKKKVRFSLGGKRIELCPFFQSDEQSVDVASSTAWKDINLDLPKTDEKVKPITREELKAMAAKLSKDCKNYFINNRSIQNDVGPDFVVIPLTVKAGEELEMIDRLDCEPEQEWFKSVSAFPSEDADDDMVMVESF